MSFEQEAIRKRIKRGIRHFDLAVDAGEWGQAEADLRLLYKAVKEAETASKIPVGNPAKSNA